ncbi:dephospho-CoA kinase [Pontibacter sp. G13]|uniref:dephospho-CoA kinase n=1 Tax=Pontibacter sp. G13 TaxID=3074898 RepID=UPI00288B81C4|nr:dephospho-CoA kinase [Pontibacter sp. G13]WNJ18033.1 dephospho-CoA kinase [Pontibacter sp. G13]
MLHVGITGGIGSGKSWVCSQFKDRGYVVYEADLRAKMLMTNDAQLVADVKQLFGEKAYFPDGSLNRKLIGGIVFQDPAKLQALNQVVHPATARDYQHWSNHEIPSDYPHAFVLKEAAILFESGAYHLSDAVLAVYAPKSLRLTRTMNRDETDEASVLARMDKQWPESRKWQLADFTIINDGAHEVRPQVEEAIEFFNQMAHNGR